MSIEKETPAGLTSGRNWGAFPEHSSTLEWSVDPESGMVQGPLDLEFLRGKRVLLSLEQRQTALLLCENQLQAIYLDGVHQLEIGKQPNQVSTSSSLVFLASDQPLQLRWTKLDPIAWDNPFGLGMIGHCSLQIDAPASFYRSFLASTTCWDDQALSQAIDNITRQTVASILETTYPAGQATEVEIQSRLTHLQAEEVSDGLAEFGLACTQISIYTASPPVELNPAESAGHFPELVHN